MTYQIKKICIGLAALLLCLPFSACKQTSATQSFPEPITGSKLESLRAEYPYVEGNPFASVVGVSELKDFNKENFAGFVQVTITGKPEILSTSLAPAEGMDATTITNYQISAHVDSVLYQSNLFSGEHDIKLCLSGAANGQNIEKYAEGLQFVVAISIPYPNTMEAELKAAYLCSCSGTYYVTDQNFLLEMSQAHPAIYKYSGWNLEAFCQELNRVFS